MDTSFVGNDIVFAPSVDIADCQAQCQAVDECVGVTLFEGNCYVKSKMLNELADPNAISAPKFCVGIGEHVFTEANYWRL